MSVLRQRLLPYYKLLKPLSVEDGNVYWVVVVLVVAVLVAAVAFVDFASAVLIVALPRNPYL